ncbi:hypothetical protein [Amycolatopsis sp. cmx-4-68]|uniref:hypothetical protein n=1 Tax=Amycolatopsis sp. cmx-4-68 TaxID=2790938 RepID=UPI00397B6C11
MTRLSRNLFVMIGCVLVFSMGSGPASAQPSAALSWTGQQSISGSGTSAEPALTPFGNRLYAMWKGTGTDTGLYWSSTDGTTWAGQQKMPNAGSSEGPGLAALNGTLYAMWKGSGSDPGLYWASASAS